MNSHFHDVRMRGFRDRAEVRDVLALLDGRLAPLPAEAVAVTEAAGRVLAEAVVSAVAVPHFPRAAMDGYALRAEETFGAGSYNPLSFRVVGEALPGRPFPGRVGPGEAVRIMTGAPIPEGADAVLQAEAAEEEAGGLRVAEPVSPGRHIGRIGEDIEAGRTVLPAGRVLRPQDVGLLASIGAGTVSVVRRPRVALLVTGDELLPPGAKPEGFRIVDSNSVVLFALVRRDGGLPLPVRYLPDRPELLRSAFLDADADAILVSGGTSVGKEDHAPRLLSELGELPVHGVALRPASPTGVGFLEVRSAECGMGNEMRDREQARSASEGGPSSIPHSALRTPHSRVPVFLLPGNPVSCLCAYDLFAGRAVRRLGGRPAGLPYRSAELPLAGKIVSAVGRVDYVRVRVTEAGVEPIAVSGASLLSTTVAADGFVLVERDREGFGPGERVRVYFYDDPGSGYLSHP